MKKLLKKLLPEEFILRYHYFVALLAAIVNGLPSKKMIVIGVTGTKGKTSTINFIWSCLQAGGYKTGIISTANIRIGDREFLNKYHMTMPGRFVIQNLLSQMVKEGCKFCIIETTSEGIKQYRHTGIYYDIAVI
jgi:UDP-N-acetylmuramoyl-L-alanyl-D-glutamate--2,6-diaminopimelate ligase